MPKYFPEQFIFDFHYIAYPSSYEVVFPLLSRTAASPQQHSCIHFNCVSPFCIENLKYLTVDNTNVYTLNVVIYRLL